MNIQITSMFTCTSKLFHVDMKSNYQSIESTTKYKIRKSIDVKFISPRLRDICTCIFFFSFSKCGEMAGEVSITISMLSSLATDNNK